MCRVLPFPPPPDDATRDLLSMVTDDLQILAIHEPPTVLTAARLIAARANATRTRRWGTAPGAAPADDDLPRVTRSNLRLLAVYQSAPVPRARARGREPDATRPRPPRRHGQAICASHPSSPCLRQTVGASTELSPDSVSGLITRPVRSSMNVTSRQS